MTNTDLMNVNAFENQLPDAAFAALNPADESLADGIGQSYGIVGYRGKIWSLRYRGETYQFLRADDGSPAAFLDVIILRSASYRSKSFYEGGYQDGQTGQRPTCSSLDGVQPDADAAHKQSTACAICPRNEFKTNAQGRKGKDCSDYKRLAVLVLPSQSAALFGGQPLMEPVFLRVPAASLNDLAMLGEAMQKKGFHYATYITRIGFDTEKAHPQMTFRALQKLSANEAPIVMQLREDPASYRITGENEVGKPKPSGQIAGNGGHVASQSTAPANTASSSSTTTAQTVQQNEMQRAPQQQTTSPSKPAEVKQESEIERLQRMLAEAQAKAASTDHHVAGATSAAQTNTAAAPTATVQPASEKVDTGFGALSGEVIPPTTKAETKIDTGFGLGASQPVVEVSPTSSGSASSAGNTVEDTGPADESDADLDAKVAALLGR